MKKRRRKKTSAESVEERVETMMKKKRNAALLLCNSHPNSFSYLHTMLPLQNSFENEAEFDEAVKYSAGEGKQLSDMYPMMLDSCKASL